MSQQLLPDLGLGMMGLGAGEYKPSAGGYVGDSRRGGTGYVGMEEVVGGEGLDQGVLLVETGSMLLVSGCQ